MDEKKKCEDCAFLFIERCSRSATSFDIKTGGFNYPLAIDERGRFLLWWRHCGPKGRFWLSKAERKPLRPEDITYRKD